MSIGTNYSQHIQPNTLAPINSSGNSKLKNSVAKKIVKNLFTLKGLVVVLLIAQAISIYLIINPPYLASANESKKILNEIEKLTDINTFEDPVISRVKDIDKIKEANSLNAEVYKDAKNGDYLIGYTDKLIIYRRDDDKIVYEGDSPNTILNKQQQALAAKIVSKSKEMKLLDDDDQVDNAQLSIVTDEAKIKETDPAFYQNARKGDIIALFPTQKLVVLYNQESDTVVNYGNFTTVINPL